MERLRLPAETKRKRRKRKRRAANRKTFTYLSLRRLKPKDRQFMIWDEGTPGQKGLGLLVSPGGTKSFRSTYYFPGLSKPHSRKLGRFPDMTFGEARDLARKDRQKAADGIDPKEEARTALVPVGETVEEVIDLFIELYAKPRQRTWRETRRTLKTNCKAWLATPIKQITKRQVYELLDGFVADGKPYKAAVTLSWLRTLWRWAWKRDIVDQPLMDSVDIHIEKRERDWARTDDDLKAIWNAANELEPGHGAYIKLLVLLGLRKNELAKARRSDLDDSDNPTLLVTPFENTKSNKNASRKRVYLTPLPSLAQRIIKTIPVNEDAPDVLFPGRFKGRPLDPGQWLLKKLQEAGAPSDFTYHQVRYTVATWLQEQGHDEYERGLVLNHAGGGTVTDRYSRSYPLQLKRELFEKWAGHVEAVVSPLGVALLR